MPRQAHNSNLLAKPVGPFPHAVCSGEPIYLSGQVGQEPATGKLVEGGLVAQTRQIFRNFLTLLSEFELNFDDVVKVNVFLSTMDDFAAMNNVCAEYLLAPYPARTTLAVKGLPLGALVEMEMIARGR